MAILSLWWILDEVTVLSGLSSQFCDWWIEKQNWSTRFMPGKATALYPKCRWQREYFRPLQELSTYSQLWSSSITALCGTQDTAIFFPFWVVFCISLVLASILIRSADAGVRCNHMRIPQRIGPYDIFLAALDNLLQNFYIFHIYHL
jgi:hypothetical protein